MPTIRVALANVSIPSNREESVALAAEAVAQAGAASADIVCFPECYVPGYRALGRSVESPDAAFLDLAWSTVAAAAAKANVAVILGTERIVNGTPRIAAIVIQRDGTVAGFQEKVQLDPSEDGIYAPGNQRQIFESGPLKFGIVICHEGWRYPETVRWAARRGAQIVFHPHFHEAELGGYRPSSFGDPANSFHEKAVLCRAAENTCYFASVNCASEGGAITSAVARPDGSLLCWQPYGKPGLLVAEIDLARATGLLASRCKTA